MLGIQNFMVRNLYAPDHSLDLQQVDLFFILDLFISLERSEKVISSDEVARASASNESREKSSFPMAKPTGQARMIGKDV